MVMKQPRANPFSTRYVRPGSLDYVFPTGQDGSQLVERLRQAGWWGQVTGPHGAGKTTLLHSLSPLLEQSGRRLEWFTLRAGQKRLPPTLDSCWHEGDARALVIVDGYEQLAWHARWHLKRRCRHAGSGLLVTTHADVGLPSIYHLRPSLPLVRQLVTQLLQDCPDLLTDQEVAHCFQACSGNIREVLFALYDLYELRRPHL